MSISETNGSAGPLLFVLSQPRLAGEEPDLGGVPVLRHEEPGAWCAGPRWRPVETVRPANRRRKAVKKAFQSGSQSGFRVAQGFIYGPPIQKDILGCVCHPV